MRKLRKPPVGKAKEKKQEPLAEGLQIVVPTDSAGRRMWSRMNDGRIIELAQKFMKENRITGRKELEDTYRDLYYVLQRRKLLDRIGFIPRKRSWKSMTDEEIVELAKETMKENGISRRKDLKKYDSGLLSILTKRRLGSRVGFVENQRSWVGMSDEEMVEFARKVIPVSLFNFVFTFTIPGCIGKPG